MVPSDDGNWLADISLAITSSLSLSLTVSSTWHADTQTLTHSPVSVFCYSCSLLTTVKAQQGTAQNTLQKRKPVGMKWDNLRTLVTTAITKTNILFVIMWATVAHSYSTHEPNSNPDTQSTQIDVKLWHTNISLAASRLWSYCVAIEMSLLTYLRTWRHQTWSATVTAAATIQWQTAVSHNVNICLRNWLTDWL